MLPCKILTIQATPTSWGPPFFLGREAFGPAFLLCVGHGPGWQRSPTRPAAGTSRKGAANNGNAAGDQEAVGDPAAYNPRKDLQPEDSEYQKLSQSLDRFGCVEPVVWNERTGNVVGGHQRLKILLAAGETELDGSVVNLSDADEKALNIALNKIVGEWDTAALTELLQELSADSSVDETLTGFDQGELDSLLADLEGRPLALE